MCKQNADVDTIIKAAGIPACNANACLYTELVQDLACELVNLARVVHSSITGGANVPWRHAFEQMLAAQEVMTRLDRALMAMVTPQGDSDGLTG